MFFINLRQPINSYIMKSKKSQREWERRPNGIAANSWTIFEGEKYVGQFTLAAPYGDNRRQLSIEMDRNSKLIIASPELLQSNIDSLKSFQLLRTLTNILDKKSIVEIDNRIKQIEKSIKKATS